MDSEETAAFDAAQRMIDRPELVLRRWREGDTLLDEIGHEGIELRVGPPANASPPRTAPVR